MSVDTNFHSIDKDRARDCYISAEIAFKKRQWEAARIALKQCMGYDPTKTEPYELATRLYLTLSKPDVALQVLENWSKITDNPSPEYFVLRAKALLQLGRFEECKKAIEDCFDIHEGYDGARLVLADYFVKTSRSSEAVSIYFKIHEKDPANKDIIYSLAYAHFQQKDWDGTITWCAKLIDNRIKHAAIQDLYIRALKEKKKEVNLKNPGKNFIQKVFTFFYDPITEKDLRMESQNEWEKKRQNLKLYMDKKTGIWNESALHDRFAGKAQQVTSGLFLGAMDVNFFKYYNEKFNYDVGTTCLKALASLGNDAYPDWFFRSNEAGDEFFWVKEGDEKEVLAYAEAFRKTVEEKCVERANKFIRESRPPEGADMRVSCPICKGTGKDPLDPSNSCKAPNCDDGKQRGVWYTVERKINISMGIAQYLVDGRDIKAIMAAANANLKLCNANGKNAISFKNEVIFQGEKPTKPEVGGR